MNNKGFMMAEVIVVASIVLVAMTGLYTSYNKIIAIYNQRVNYYDVATLYELGNYKKNGLIENTKLTPLVNSSGKVIYYVNLDVVKKNTLTVNNQTFKDYLKYLSTSINFDELAAEGVNKILLMEKCIDNEGNVDIDNCKYAYLEVFDDED